MKKIFFVFILSLGFFLLTSTNAFAADSIVKVTISLPDGSHPISVAVDSVHHRAYVAAQNPNKLYVVDTESDLVVNSTTIDFSPDLGIAVVPSKEEVYLGDYPNNSVTVFNGVTLSIVKTFSVSGNAGPMAVNENTGKLYIAGSRGAEAGFIDIVDINTHEIIDTFRVGPQPWGIAINPNTNKLYVSSAMNQPGLTIIDALTNSIITTLLLDDMSNRALAIDSIQNRIYLTNPFQASIYAIDGVTDIMLVKIPVTLQGYNSYPLGLVVDSTLHKAFTATSNARSEILITDTVSNNFVQKLTLEPETGPRNTFLFLGIDEELHKVYAPHNSSSYIAVITESNNPPLVNSMLNKTLNEGSTYTESGSFSDPDADTWTGTVDYGDGAGVQNLSIDQQNKTFDLSHVYADNGIYTVTVRVTDDQGAAGTETATVTVNNVLPSVGAITASVNPILVNTSTTATASFADAGVLDTHAAVWDWGDGTTSNATLTETNGSGSVSDSHTYATAGVYEIGLTVTDDDGGAGTQVFQYLSVYSPTAQGLFSAGQKYTSEYLGLSGNAMFGLSYKYQGEVPVSNRQFTMDIKSANFEFNATAISSLVIANGVGTLRGSGTVNGAGVYSFLVVGREGTDMIRIKITNPSNNNAVVYDTQPGASDTADPTTSVTAGNVLAH